MSAASENAWRDVWRRVETRQAVALLLLTSLQNPSTNDSLTIHAATTEITTPDGQHWEPVLVDAGNVRSTSSFLSYDVNPATMAFTLADRRFSCFPEGSQLSRMLSVYQFIGGTCELWFWERSLTDIATALSRFRLGIVQSYRTRVGKVDFTAIQDPSWNQAIQPRVITRADFPHALEDAVGSSLPIVIGKVGGPPMRTPPYTGEYTVEQLIRDRIAGGGRVGQAALVDVGRSDQPTQRAKVMVASHAVKQLGALTAGGSSYYGTSPYLEGLDGFLHQLQPDPAADIFNAADGAGFYIPIGTAFAYYPLFPTDIETTTNPSDNQRVLLDRTNEFGFAGFDFAANKISQLLRMPSAPDCGDISGNLIFYVLYRSDPNIRGFRARIINTVTYPTSAAQVLALPATASQYDVSFASLPIPSSAALMPTSRWAFNEWQIIFEYSGGAPNQGWADVFLTGVAVPYAPRRDILSSKRVVGDVKVTRRRRVAVPFSGRVLDVPHTTFEHIDRIDNVSQLRAKVFSNVFGAPDDGSGTFTGVPNAQIEKVADAFRYILRTYGAVADSDIEQGAGEFGSLADAKTLMRTWNQRDMIAGLSIIETLDLSAVIPWVSSIGVAQPIISEMDGRWRLVPWLVAPEITYTSDVTRGNTSLQVSRFDLLGEEGPQVSTMPEGSILSGLRIAYGWDAQRGSFAHEVSVAGDRSSSGYAFRNVRDGIPTVVAGANDKVDVALSGGGFNGSLSLTPGWMDGWTRALDLKAKLVSTLDNGFDNSRVGFGPRTLAGYNAVVSWNDNGTARTMSLGTQTFPSYEAAVAAVVTALNSVGSAGWSGTFNRSQLKATFSRPGAGTYQIKNSAVGTVWPMFGIEFGDTTVPVTSTVVVEENRYWFWHLTTAVDFRWRSGANGLDGTKQSAWEVLGADWQQDDLARGRRVWSSIAPKFDSERPLAPALGLPNRKKRDVSIDARGVYDTSTALEMRNRIAALLGKARAYVTFSSEVLADLRVGDVFEFSGDLDLITAYPVADTDGSWAGKRFRVLETTQHFGTSWHTEIVAIDLTD